MKYVVLTLASLIFALGIGALVQAVQFFGLRDATATLNGAALLTLVHFALLLPPLLIGWLLARRLPPGSFLARWLHMSPFRWSLALALGPSVGILAREVFGVDPNLAPSWWFLLGVASLAVLLRVLPRSPWRAAWIHYAGATASLLLLASTFGGLSMGARTASHGSKHGIAPPGAADIVIISIDTLRADALDAPGVTLPALEFLAANGTRRRRALAPAPYTLPSHVSLLSGASPLEHGCYSNFHSVPESVDMLAEALLRQGYQTHAVVSNAVLSRNSGIAQGFESYDDARVAMNPVLLRAQERLRRGTWLRWLPGRREFMMHMIGVNVHAMAGSTTKLALQELRDLRDSEQPFFLFLHYMDPHLPYEPDPSVRGSLSGSVMPPHSFGEKPGSHKELDALAALLPERDAAALETLDYYHRSYLEDLTFVDTQLGIVLEELRNNGRPTVLLFTSDHGEHFGEYDLIAHGNSLHWPVLEVPWILWSKEGLPPQVEVPELPRLEDARALLFACAGLEDDAATGRERPLRSFAHWQTPPEIAIHDGQSKLIARYFTAADGSFDFAEVRYYDLNQDPHELVDVADQHPEKVIELLKYALEHLGDAMTGEVQEIGDLQRARMQALGYVE